MSNVEKRRMTRIARNTSAAVVATIAGYASYWHQVAVAGMAGERQELAHILPLSVDGLLVVASVAMVDARAEGRKPSWQTKVAFVAGISASVGSNVMSAHPTLLGRAVAAWPALALLLVVETLSSKGKLRREQAPTAPVAQQVEQVLAAAAVQNLPVPVSPAPATEPVSPARVMSGSGSGPIPRREARSPLTGKVLTDRAPRV
jgi:uncharacterized protein DUF2637